MPVPTRPRAALAAGLAASLLLAPLTVLGAAAPASAAITVPFTQRFSANTNGAVVIRGNTLSTCSTAVAGCLAAQGSTGSAAATSMVSNNDFTNVFVDVDADPTTFNSSSAEVTVPPGGAVLYAALVWGGRTETSGTAAPDASKRGQAKLAVPGGTGYQTVVADQVHELSTNGTPGAYQGFVDVTDEVRAAGSGAYTVADVQAARDGDRYAGWSLVLAVSDPLAPARNLTVYSGFGSVTSGSGPVNIAVDGFLTPPAGPVRTSLGFVTYEGDQGLVGDSLQLDGVSLSDARNPATNIFNSSVTDAGTDTAGRTPSYANQLGFDADQVAADGVLKNGASAATIRLTTGGETFYPGVVTFATDLYDPKLLGTKTVDDVDGGVVEAGDELLYTVPVQNVGLDAASGSRFFDAVPTGTTYVPGSLSVDGVALTDADGDDTGAFVPDGNQGHLTVNVGAGATATRGGSVPADGGATTYVVRFRATVDPGTTDGQELVNAAALTYRGLSTQASSASATNAVISPVVDEPSGGNRKPVASSHVLSFTPAPGARSLRVPVLQGDTDPDGDTLTVIGLTDAAGGPVVLDPDGTVTYSPRDDVAGRDVFTYTISDGKGGTSTATVQVDVVNTAPVAAADTASTPGGVARTVDVLANDTDANGDTRTVRSVAGASTQGGTVALQPDGTVRYTPKAAFTGTDTFTYVVQDSRGGSDTATVTVTVTNNLPVAGDDSYATQAGVPVAVAVAGNDTDADGDALTVTRLSGPSNGTLTLGADGRGTYTPAPGFTGTDTVTYRVTDARGGQSAPATLTVRVNAAPVAVDDDGTTGTDEAVTVDVVADDTDSDGDTLAVTAVTDGSHGTVVLDAAGTVTYRPAAGWAGADTFTYVVSDGRGGTDEGTVTVVTENAAPVLTPRTAGAQPGQAVTVDVLVGATDANIPGTDQALTVSGAAADDGATVSPGTGGQLTVTPADGFKGVVTVTYTVSDGAGGETQGTLTVTVDDAAPVAVPDGPVRTPTGTSVLVDVLANDVDLNGDELSVVEAATTEPVDASGEVRGTVALEDGGLRYTPPAGFAGTVTFSVTVTDGELTSTAPVTVVVENAVPVAVDDTATTAAGTPVTVDVLADDTDANIPGTDQELTVTAASADQGATVVRGADGTLTVTPAPGYKGSVVVSYTVSDGAGGTASATLTVTVGDAAPVAGPDTATTPYATPVTVDLLDDDTDANGDDLDVVPGSVTAPVDASGTTRGTVTVSGGVATYTPPAGFSGTVTFSYTVTDGELRSTATVTVTVGNAPPAAAPEQVTVPSTGGPVTIDVLGNDGDADGGTLTIVSVTQPEHGSVAIVDGKLVYTPEPGYSGAVLLSYTVSDGQGGTSTGTVTIDVVAGEVPDGPGPGPDAGGPAPQDPAPGDGTPGPSQGGGSTPLPSRLARTGAEVTEVVVGALALLLVGSGLVVLGQRHPLPSLRGRHRA